DAGTGIGELAHRAAGPGAQRPALAAIEAREPAGLTGLAAIVAGLHLAAVIDLDIAAIGDPAGPQRRPAGRDVDDGLLGGIGAGAVVEAKRRLAGAWRQRPLAHGNAKPGMALTREMDLAGCGKRAGDDAALGSADIGHDDLLPQKGCVEIRERRGI